MMGIKGTQIDFLWEFPFLFPFDEDNYEPSEILLINYVIKSHKTSFFLLRCDRRQRL
jgi:hypothetical protein